jgi:hypothetical protein
MIILEHTKKLSGHRRRECRMIEQCSLFQQDIGGKKEFAASEF